MIKLYQLRNSSSITTASGATSETLVMSDLFIPFIIITGILAGLTIYYLQKSLKKSSSK